jgi:AsmA-like protein
LQAFHWHCIHFPGSVAPCTESGDIIEEAQDSSTMKFRATMDQTTNSTGTPRKTNWRFFLGAALITIIAVAAIVLAFKWPFSKQKLVESIQEVVPAGKVEIATFRTNVFPDPGCEAESVVIHLANNASLPPLVTAQQIKIQARYSDLFFRPGYIARIVIKGLMVKVPPFGRRGRDSSSSDNNISSTAHVGEIIANGAIVEIDRDEKSPLTFQIHSLALKSVNRDKPFTFDVALTNAVPPGEIVSDGQIGPWNRDEWGKTPVSGDARFQNANLHALPGIGGTLSSVDRFAGTLDQIRVDGTLDIPDFVVKIGGHSTAIHTQYLASVNATNGDVVLENTESTIAKTKILASGKIANVPGTKGKTTSLSVEVNKGMIQDVLDLFVSEPKPPLDGDAQFHALLQVPPQSRPFLNKLNLRGDFRIAGGRFTKADTQRNVNDLSWRARGENHGNAGKETPENVLTDMNGHVDVRNGIAHFSDLFVRSSGAVAHMEGNYYLITQKIDFHGALKTEAELSQTTNGVKSALLKPFNRLFKRKHAGADVPVQMTGTYHNPHFGMELNPIKALKK